MPAPRGTTTVAAVIGDPVTHSLSPVLHNAAFEALGIDWVYVAFPVLSGTGASAVAAMRSLRLGGLSVTMPHKLAVAAAADRRSATVERLGSANTLYWEDGIVVAESTDGRGFLAALAEAGFAPAGRRALLLGAGGAARAVALALAEAGAREVRVAARRPGAAAQVAAIAGVVGTVGAVDGLRGDLPGGRGNVGVGEFDLVVNATPVGMGYDAAAAGTLVRTELLQPGQFVADLVYGRTPTPLVELALRRGVHAQGGGAMLIHQAALQFELWTGRQAPLDVMRQALARRLIAG